MEVILIVVVILIVIYLLISRYFRRHNQATERTLRTIGEWVILAQSVSSSEKDVMCYSLILQSGLALDKLQAVKHSEFIEIVTLQGFSNTNFVYMVLNAALTTFPENWIKEMATPNNQARVFFAQCLTGLMERGISDHKGLELIRVIAEESRQEVLEWNIPTL